MTDTDTEKIKTTTASYDRTAASFAAKNFGISLAEQREKFLSLLPKTTGPLLDLGCGPGRDTISFERAGYAVVGADLSSGMLAEGQRRSPESHFVQADMRRLPFERAAFKGIWACASLLHLPKSMSSQALSEMNRVLAGRGALFLGVKRGLDESWRLNGEDLRFYFAYYLPSEIRNLVADNGFEIRGMAESTSTTNTETDGQPVRWINVYAVKS